MILTNDQLNKLHLLFQNFIVANSADEPVDFDRNIVNLIISLLEIYIERQTAPHRT